MKLTRKARVITIANDKGGAGKTTTTIALAVRGARRGLRTLMIDADSQHALSRRCFSKAALTKLAGRTLYQAFREKIPLAKVIQPVIENLDMIPADAELNELFSWAKIGKQKQGQVLVDQLTDSYDLILFDTGPKVEHPATHMALLAAETLVITTPLESMDSEAIGNLYEALKELGDAFPLRLKHQFIIPAKVDNRNKLVNGIIDKELAKKYGDAYRNELKIPLRVDISKWHLGTVGSRPDVDMPEYDRLAEFIYEQTA